MNQYGTHFLTECFSINIVFQVEHRNSYGTVFEKNGFWKQPFNIYAYENVFKSRREREPFGTKTNRTQLGHRVQLDTIIGIISGTFRELFLYVTTFYMFS
jgi:hypothetical protein